MSGRSSTVGPLLRPPAGQGDSWNKERMRLYREMGFSAPRIAALSGAPIADVNYALRTRPAGIRDQWGGIHHAHRWGVDQDAEAMPDLRA